MQSKTKKKHISRSQLIQIGFLLILMGVGIICLQPIHKRKMKAIDTINQKILEKEEKEEKKVKPKPSTSNPTSDELVSNVETERVEEQTPVVNEKRPASAYIGILEIPKIYLKRGFVSKDSKQNKISQNVSILKESSMPDVEGGNFILAAHSGTAAISYFKRLDELVVGDVVYVTYQNKKYTYQLEKKYREPKTGSLNIYRDKTKSSITLITCASDNDVEQIVFTGSLVSVE